MIWYDIFPLKLDSNVMFCNYFLKFMKYLLNFEAQFFCITFFLLRNKSIIYVENDTKMKIRQ